jgi:hypothetical protein
VEGQRGFTVGGVWDKFFVAHPDLVHLRLRLFNMGGVELDLNDRIFNGDELLLRPRVVRRWLMM